MSYRRILLATPYALLSTIIAWIKLDDTICEPTPRSTFRIYMRRALPVLSTRFMTWSDPVVLGNHLYDISSQRCKKWNWVYLCISRTPPRNGHICKEGASPPTLPLHANIGTTNRALGNPLDVAPWDANVIA